MTHQDDGESKCIEIEVTAEVVKAGMYEIADHQHGDDIGYILVYVYRAMDYAREDASLTRNSR